MNTVLGILLVTMLVSGITCLLVRRYTFAKYIGPVFTFLMFILALLMCIPVLNGEIIDDGMFYVDQLSAMFILLASFVGLMASVYSVAYMTYEWKEGMFKTSEFGSYELFLTVFVAIMILTFSVRSMGMVWLGIGATTLVSTFLVGFYRNDNATEASWKYIILCCVGITIALVGYTMVYSSTVGVIESNKALDWPSLMENAGLLNRDMLRMGTALVIVGFGTKVGFVPMHTWLPDAHSQAPSPVSGLLSAVLLNCAMYGILRFYSVSEIVDPGFARNLLLIFGIVSLIVSAFFIVSAKDLKRMLAYSSIENMGLIAIGFGIGTEASIAAAFMQLVAHSVTKPILFFSAGSIIQGYGTRDMASIKGASASMPFASFMLGAGTLAIVGVPPFAVFTGELSLILGSINAGMLIVTAATVIPLMIVFAGFTMHIFPMLRGDKVENVREEISFARCAPLIILLAIALILGLFVPDFMQGWLDSIVGVVI